MAAPSNTARQATQLRVAEIRTALDRLVESLQATPAGKPRHQLYALCVPLFTELERLNVPPFPRREILPLIREAHWHLRSLAGLTTLESASDAEHAAWARDSLERLGESKAFG